MTLVDSLGTLWLMGLTEEFRAGTSPRASAPAAPAPAPLWLCFEAALLSVDVIESALWCFLWCARSGRDWVRDQLDFGPSSQFAACLFSIDLTQIVTYQGQPPIVIKSRLQFCEVPSTEVLVAEGSGGGQQLSLQLKRSLVQFRNVVRSLSAGGDAPDYANYDS